MGTIVCVCETKNPCGKDEITVIEERKGTLDFSPEASKLEDDEETVVKGQPVGNVIRKPTGLFSVELVFMDGSESKIFNIESNTHGLEFEARLPFTVSRVKDTCPPALAGVKPGMTLNTVAGQDVQNSCQTVNACVDLLDKSIRALPPLPNPDELQKLSEFKPSDSPPKKESTADKLLLKEDIVLTGPWAKWSTNFPNAVLEPVPTDAKNVKSALLKMCVKMTSQSFTFQVITDKRQWKWHLFPKEAVPIRVMFMTTHVSKEGLLTEGKKDAAKIGLGDDKLGHGVNFHVMEKTGTIVTVWVEVPAKKSADGTHLVLRTDTVEGARIWYTYEDTGITLTQGDGMDLSTYKSYLPAEACVRLGI